MTEQSRPISLQDAAESLGLANGNFAKNVLCSEQGERSARGTLLMAMGVVDEDLMEMTPKDANTLLKRNITGITDIQIALLNFINDRTVQRSSGFLTSRLADTLVRPERFLGNHAQLVLVADRLVHGYTDLQRSLMPTVHWDNWETIVAVSAAKYCSSKASDSEAGDFPRAYVRLGGHTFDERSAAVLDAWDHVDLRVESFGYKKVHTNFRSWFIARHCAQESTQYFDPSLGAIYVNAVNEIQGHEFYETFKTDKEHPKQPEHKPFFLPMLTDLEGEPLSIKTLWEYAHKHKEGLYF